MGSIFLLSGDSCIVLEFGKKISPEINMKVLNMFNSLNEANINGVTEIIPTYRSLYINYDPLLIQLEDLKNRIRETQKCSKKIEFSSTRVVEIPTLYGGKYGPDLLFVAEYHQISPSEVVDIHTSKDYLVYMLGFTPGFAYLGELSNIISTPRLETPRLKVPAGTVAIAGTQTGIYPVESPGGWRLLGRTPIELFNPYKDPPALLKPSDHVRFIQIDEDEYKNISRNVAEGDYDMRLKKNGEES
jgi:KipI family sensor histidine kinase inhibitor